MRAESIESRRLDAGNLGGSRADHHAMLPSSFKFDHDHLVDEDDDDDDEEDDDDHYFRLSASASASAAAASLLLNEADSANRDDDDGPGLKSPPGSFVLYCKNGVCTNSLIEFV